jgi:hypothetical protein
MKHGKLATVIAVIFILLICIIYFYNKLEPESDPKDRQYSKSEWMTMITQPQHQATATFEGVAPGSIQQDGSSGGGGALHFIKTAAGMLERQCIFGNLLDKDPLMFLPALASKDQRVILTGMYIYQYNWPDKLTDEQKNQIANAYRSLLSNPDTGVRSEVINQLSAEGLLSADDIIKGLSDDAQDVRYLAAFHCHTVYSQNSPVYTKEGKIHKGDPQKVNELIESKRKLIPVLLKHLNETNPFTRYDIAQAIYNMFTKIEYTGSGTRRILPDSVPKQIDWKRDSWHKREETKEIWTKWWTERGEEAIEFAHPTQNTSSEH